MSRLKIAVVGVGALGRHHARILADFDCVELVAVADTNSEAGQRVAHDCRTRWIADYRDILADVDAVTVAVPTGGHRSVAADFLSRGIPTLIEKPLAGNLQDAEALVRLADQHNTLLQVGHVERFNPATRVAWDLCGPPKYIRAERLSPYAFRSTDIGVVHDLMIHDLDLVLDLVGAEVRDVEAFGISILGGHEDSVQARVRFLDGCIADFTANRVHPTARRTMQIWWHGGCVDVDFTSREVVSYEPSDSLLYGIPILERARWPGADVEQLKRQVFGDFLKVIKPDVPPGDALTGELSGFVVSVQQRQPPICDGHQALKAMQIADRVLDCVSQHQWDGNPDGAVGPFARMPGGYRLAG